jgi:tight adherence protein B
VLGLFGGGIGLALLVAAAVWIVPGMMFEYLGEVRIQKLEAGLPRALEQMASSARAGLSLAQLVEEIAATSQPPASEEFGLILQDFRLGADMETAIENARTRLNSKTFGLFASALVVNREKGGNLPEALDTMSKSFKEIARLEEKFRTASAEGRKAVKVISLMPLFIFLMIAFLQPEIIETLTSTFAGWVIIVVAIGFYAAGLWWLRRLLRIDV